MPGACAGIRVLDLSGGIAGPLATMVLADYGADVVRVEPSDGDPGWDEPAYLLLQRGKRSIGLDLRSEAVQAEVRRLAVGMDVVVETLVPGKADEAGIGYRALSALNPGLICCSITGFGRTGPFAQVKPYDALVLAKAGVLRDQPGRHEENGRPVFQSAKDPSYFAAMLAVQGILAALRARELTGRGQRVETTMLEALTCRNNHRVPWMLREGEELPPDTGPRRPPLAATPIGGMLQCKDGRWILHSNTEPHFFKAWISVLGLDWIWDDDRLKGAPRQFPDAEARAELNSLIEQRLKEKTAQEWMEIYLTNKDVCAEMVQTTQEALRHRQVVEAGYLVEVDDPRVGRILQVGPLANIPGAPASVRAPAPLPGQHTEEVLKSEVEPVPARRPTGVTMRGPLDGMTILEAAYYYAAPFAGTLLAELGARVIKIEPVTGDRYRTLVAGNQNMVRAMQGKESLAVNLQDERGQEIFHRLAAKADGFLHSFRPGVPESLRIDHDTLRRINPRLVYQYAGSYGSVGPSSRRPAYDGIIGALAGQTAFQSGEGNSPVSEEGVDPISGAGHATAMMLGLLARERSGERQYVESTMTVSALYAMCEDALSYEGKPPRPAVDRLQLGTAATYRLYETAPPDRKPDDPWENAAQRWVFLAAPHDDEFARFCSIIRRDDLARDPRFETVQARQENRAALEALLEPAFKTRTAREWETTLLNAGIGCVRADAMSHHAFLHGDPQAKAIEMMVQAEHPAFGGRYWRHAPLLKFSETPGRAGPFFEAGEHTRAILGELGYSGEEMTGLREANIIAWPAQEPEAVIATA